MGKLRQPPVRAYFSSSPSVILFPFWKDAGIDLSATNEFLQIPNDRASRDFELSGECGNIWAPFDSFHQLEDFILPAQTIGRPA